MRIFTWILAFCVLLVAGYYIWGYTGKDYSSLHAAAVPINIITDSADKGKGNLLAIQPWLTISAYCDQQHFHDALSVYFKKAQAAGLLRQNTIVVLPENIGSWLAFANEKASVYEADSMRQAVSTIVNSNIFVFIQNLLLTPVDDKIKHAFVYMKAASMVKIYTAVFSSLAKEFKVTIAAGSIILPQPSLDAKGRIRIKKGDLYYSAFMFGPDGKIQGRPVLKVLPEYRQTDTTAEPDSNLMKITQTPAGSVVIAANEDFHLRAVPDTKKMVRISAGIFFNGTDKIWNAVWKGKNGFAIPMDAIKSSDDTSFSLKLSINTLFSPQHMPSGLWSVLRMHNGFNGNLWEISYQNRLSIDYPVRKMSDREAVKLQGVIVNNWFY